MELKKSLKSRRSRYRVHQQKHCIDLRLRDWQQIFDSRDPAPFRERDLDDDAVQYILAAMTEFGPASPVKVVINLPLETSTQVDQKMIRESIHSYFEYERELNRKKGRELFRQGQVSLGVGVSGLGIFVLLSYMISKSGEGLLTKALYEGLNVMGWVAMWRPIDTFLYAWWPVKRLNDLYKRLSQIEVDFLFH